VALSMVAATLTSVCPGQIGPSRIGGFNVLTGFSGGDFAVSLHSVSVTTMFSPEVSGFASSIQTSPEVAKPPPRSAAGVTAVLAASIWEPV